MSESFAELFEESLNQTEMSPGQVVIGTVADISDGYVIVTAGLKSEGVIPVDQFKNLSGDIEVTIGDDVEVVLEAVEDGFGETRLSREKAKRAKAWKSLETSYETEEIITGIITGKVKGGFTVELGDIRAFLPGSLVDIPRFTAMRSGNRIVLSSFSASQRPPISISSSPETRGSR